MYLPCENPTSSCPVVFPATYPSPRCDCQEDRSTPRHCRLCRLPFDIESRLRPDSGLRTFCSCFLGESRVLTVSWIPVFFYLPISRSPGDSGRSSSSRLSTESSHSLPSSTSRHSTGSNHSLRFTVDSCLGKNGDSSRKHCTAATIDDCSPKDMNLSTETNHSLPSTIDACLGENIDYSQKHCTEATLDGGSPKHVNLSTESNHSLPSTVDACLEENIDSSRKERAGEASGDCLPKDAIRDCSVGFDHPLPRSCPADYSTASDSIQDSFVESTCSLLQKDNIVAKDSDLTLLSDEAVLYKDSISLETERDCANYGKGIFTEIKHLQTPPGETTNKKGTLEFDATHLEGNKSRTNENLNARELVFSDGNNFEASPDFSNSAYNKPVSADESLLEQVPRDNGKESTSSVNVSEPFISAENGAFSAFEKRNQYSLTRTQMFKETLREIHKPVFLNTNELNLNSNTSCLGNRHQMNNHSQPRHPSSSTFYVSYPTASRYPSNTLNVSEPSTNHSSLPQTTPAGPGYEDFTQFALLNSIEAESITANVNNSEELRNPSNSHIAQVRYPFQYSNVNRIHHPRLSEAEQHAVNVSRRRDTPQVGSVQPNRMTTQEHMSSENSSVHPGYNPHGNLASSNAGRGMFEINFGTGLGEGSGFMGAVDWVQEIFNMNLNRSSQVAEFIRNMK